MESVIIIGSGPAGHTAAIYTARASLNPLLFEGMMAGGIAAGGQLTTTTEIENFPGFPEGISGPELMVRMREQSMKCGARIKTQTVERLDLSKRPFSLFLDSGETVEARAIVVATGATARRMNILGEEKFWQRGISACAVCDGALPIFRNKVLVVVGGGDSAIEEASHLTKTASKVILMHRRDELRASKAMQKRAFDNPKIEILWNTIPVEAKGEKFLSSLKIKNVKTGEESEIASSGLFYAIGHTPNTAFLGGQIELDDAGYVKTVPGSTLTSVKGVFACGDVQDKRYRQAITSAGSGCMAALDVEHFLNDHT
ncbi:MAG: thioredoxin-disulfide reductase [Candidatus Omnitrophica bacterium]|nr:thioredoxin-disulfide reductase [Candidatus Omnitrophota bacterium]